MGFPADLKFYEWFYKVILTSANSVPISSLWVAFFVNPINLNRAFQTGIFENGFGFSTLAPGAGLNTAQSAFGALFANSVIIPSDGFNVNKMGLENSGMIKGNIGTGRKDMEVLQLSFLETNTSFVDFNLRPWSIYASHKSLKDPDVKTNMVVIQLGKTKYKTPLLPRKIWTFHDVCPVYIASEEYNYGESVVKNVDVDFAYNYYTLTSSIAGDAGLTLAAAFTDILKSTMDTEPVSINSNDTTGGGDFDEKVITRSAMDGSNHGNPQLVFTPTNDQIAAIVNAGADLVSGGGRFAQSNVDIPKDDNVTLLVHEAEQYQKLVKVAQDDTPSRIPFEQVKVKPEDDNIQRRQQERSKGATIPSGGGAKASIKGLADTPIFFPGDGGEGTIKVQGAEVGQLDVPDTKATAFQKKTRDENDVVSSKNVSTQYVPVDRNAEVQVTSDEVNINRNERVKVESQEVSVPRLVPIGSQIPVQIVKTKKG